MFLYLVYLAVMNLPYQIRFKRENIILLGIIPGPREPKTDINQYLQPFVKEMQMFKTGVLMDVHGSNTKQKVQCILFGVACDLPAGRKCCGFLGHSANHACTRCLKLFPGEVGAKDFSGFDRNNWPLRTNLLHRQSVKTIQEAETITERNRRQTDHGCRYSILLELDYLECW